MYLLSPCDDVYDDEQESSPSITSTALPPPVPLSTYSSSSSSSSSTYYEESETNHRRRIIEISDGIIVDRCAESSSLSLQNSGSCSQKSILTDLDNELIQLNQLASLNSIEYQKCLMENSLPSIHIARDFHVNNVVSPSNISSTTTSSPLLPQSTLLAQLSMSIHRLHAVVVNVTREADSLPDELQELQAHLSTTLNRNRKLENTAMAIYRRNIKIRSRSREDRKEIRRLRKEAYAYKNRLAKQDLQLMAKKVAQHETQSLLWTRNNRNDNNQHGVEEVDDSIASNQTNHLDQFSPLSSSTGPTLRFSATESTTIAYGFNPDAECDDDGNGQKNINHSANVASGENFLLPKARSYTVEVSLPCTIKFDTSEIINMNNQHSKSLILSSSFPNNDTTIELQDTGQENNQAASIRNNPTSSHFATTASKSVKENAFIVVGCQNFNSDTNTKPKIGSRLVEINGESVDREWTLKKLNRALADTSGMSCNTKMARISFREEVWDTTDNITKYEKVKSTKKGTKNEDNSNLSKFLGDARTASTEKVGKAFNGLGNFLQSLQ